MVNDAITEVKVSVKDLERVGTKLEQAVVGESIDSVFLGALALALITQLPEIRGEDMARGIKGMSEWIALFVTEIENPTPQNRMN